MPAPLPAVRPPREAAALAAANYGLVAWCCRRYAADGRLDQSDVRGAAHVGLMRACALYDPSSGVALSTYAARWMARAVQEETRLLHPGFVLPRPRGPRGKDRYHAEREQAVRAKVFHYGRFGEGDRPWEGSSTIPADSRPGPADVAGSADDRRWLREQVPWLPERDRTVLVLRYGLDGGGERGYDEVGKAIGRSGPRARQIAAAAVSKLRACAGAEP